MGDAEFPPPVSTLRCWLVPKVWTVRISQRSKNLGICVMQGHEENGCCPACFHFLGLLPLGWRVGRDRLVASDDGGSRSRNEPAK